MNIRDYRNTLDKISCTESFRKNMEKQLSAPPEEVYSDSDTSFERSGGYRFGRFAAAAAALVLVAATGTLFYRIKNMQPDDILPGTELTGPTSDTTEIMTERETFAAKDLIPGSSLTDRLDAGWTEAVYIPAAPATEDKAVTFSMTDVQAVLDAVSECSFVWSNENRFSDPRREEFSVDSLEIYTDGYIQQAFSSDSRLMRVAEGDWEKVVSILREQLHADESVAEEVRAHEADLNTVENTEDIKATDETVTGSDPAGSTIPGSRFADQLEPDGEVNMYIADLRNVNFYIDDYDPLKEALSECTFTESKQSVFIHNEAERFCVCSLIIYIDGYITDSPYANLMRVEDGDWNKVLEVLMDYIHENNNSEAELSIISPEKQFYTLSANISVDIRMDTMARYNAVGSGIMLYRNNALIDRRLSDNEYIFLSDHDTGFHGELITTLLDGGNDCRFDYTEHTETERINTSAPNWEVHQDETGFTSHTSGNSLYNTPLLEFQKIRLQVLRMISNFYNVSNPDFSSSAKWEDDILTYTASYYDNSGTVKTELIVRVDKYGTPLLWEKYIDGRRILHYELTDVVYNSEIEMPEPVLNVSE